MPRHTSPYFEDIRKSENDINSQYSDIYRAADKQCKLESYWFNKAREIAIRYAKNARAYAIKRGIFVGSAHLCPAPRSIYMGINNL